MKIMKIMKNENIVLSAHQHTITTCPVIVMMALSPNYEYYEYDRNVSHDI